MPVSLEPFALPDRYRLERGIAAGGMAAVYAAHDTLLDRPVAVKVLADHLNGDETARRRFAREARAAAGLSSHPGVVTIFDVGEHDGRAFLVMERFEGGTLADVHRPAPERALGWLRTVASALDAAHAQGVVHRDIKPGNLLLDDHDRVSVADFGIARIASESERFTETGQVLGTASYLSPEQATGEPATAASDRYALAVVAYELLTGAKPFTAPHFAAQARAHIEDPPPLAPGLPPEAQAVLDRGLAKSPGDRWPSATAFVEALARSLSSLRTDATTRTLTSAPRRSRLPLGLLAVGVIAALAVALALAGGNDNRAPDRAAKPRATATPEAKATATAEAKAKATPEPTAATTQAPAPAPPATAPSNAAALNAEGFASLQDGDYETAIGSLSEAVDACNGQGALNPCGYAYYNLGLALHGAGRDDEALQVLSTRLDVWGDNGNGDVQRAIDEASGDGDPVKPGKGHGKAKGHFK